MRTDAIKKICAFAVLAGMVVPVFSFAEENLEVVCKQVSESEGECATANSAECKALLEKCAKYYDEQSAAIAKDITKTTQQKNTLQNQVSTLKKKIQGLEYQISQSTMIKKDLTIQVKDTQSSIDKTTTRILDSQDQLKGILRSVYEEDKKPSFEILLEGNLSDFFSNVAYLESLNDKVGDLLDTTKNLKIYLDGQKEKMEGEVDKLQKVIALQSAQKQENEQNKKGQIADADD